MIYLYIQVKYVRFYNSDDSQNNSETIYLYTQQQ